MMERGTPRRYFDNAATSFPKPPGVVEAVRDYLENVGASAGRGVYREAVESNRVLDDCRAALRTLFTCRSDDDVIFTLNGTDALNIAIKSVVRPGEHVITTCMDHNSVLRPLSALHEQFGVEWTVVEADPPTTLIDPDAVAHAIRENTVLVAFNHASNVTGVLQPIGPVAEMCRQRGIVFLLDAAQSAGHVPIDFSSLPIDLLACPGHKGLLGPLGTGVLLVRAGFGQRLRTVREGGTGSEGEHPVQPSFLPDKFEAGSHNVVGVAGLLASVHWLLERGIGDIRAHEVALCRRMIERLDACAGLRWFGPRDVGQRVGVFSVRIEGLEPAELSATLESRFGILTRSGLHCAPYAHRTIGTCETGGTTRLALGPFLHKADVDAAMDALADIARTVKQSASSVVPLLDR
jgi:cysteine desulfurase family protein